MYIFDKINVLYFTLLYLLTAGGNIKGTSKVCIEHTTSIDAPLESDSSDVSGSSVPYIEASECRTNENEQGPCDVTDEPPPEAHPVAGSESSGDDEKAEQVLGMEVGQELPDGVDIQDGAVDHGKD